MTHVGCVFLAVVAFALVTSCVERGPARSGPPSGWETCDYLLGPHNVDLVQREMSSGTVRFLNGSTSREELGAAMTDTARNWSPTATTGAAGSDYIPCQLNLADTGQRFTARVGWSHLPMEVIASQSPEFGWRHSAGDVYSSRMPGTAASRFAFTCQVPRAHERQPSGLPLWVWIDGQGIPALGGELRAALASSLARNMSTLLACTNHPNIPAQLPS